MESEGGKTLGQDRAQVFLGNLALSRGLVTAAQLREALVAQSEAATAGKSPPLGEIMVSRGFITPVQLKTLLESQVTETKLDTGAPPAKAGPPSAKTLGKYAILRELGRGGMGVVYEAVDSVLNRRVALKMLLGSSNADAVEQTQEEERFVREAQLSANLPHHPHIVGVYEAGTVEGRRYIAMEYVNGQTFASWRKSGSVAIRQQVIVLRDVLLAVELAHKCGIIHRDLKPANILVDDRNQPHVTDFGLARMAKGPPSKLSLTVSGQIMGTPTYMSPEQAEGRKGIDRKTDIWALGVMLYEILTGRPPFRGESPIEILMKVVHDPLKPPSSMVHTEGHPALDPNIENICLKALEKDPSRRYPSAKAFADDLTRWIKGEAVGATTTQTQAKRQLWIAIGAGAAALLLIALVAVAMLPSSDKPLRQAASLLQEGRLDEAQAIYERYPDEPRAREGMARVQRTREASASAIRARRFLRDENFEAARKEIERMRTLDPDHAELLGLTALLDRRPAPARAPAEPTAKPVEAPAPPLPRPVVAVPSGVPVWEAEWKAGDRSPIGGIELVNTLNGSQSTVSQDGRDVLRVDPDDSGKNSSTLLAIDPSRFPEGICLEAEVEHRSDVWLVGSSLMGLYQSAISLESTPLPGGFVRERLILLAQRFGRLQGGGGDFQVGCSRSADIARIGLRRFRVPASQILQPAGIHQSQRLTTASFPAGLVAEALEGDRGQVTVGSRVDPQLLFDWGYGQPGKAQVERPFGSRWKGYLLIPETGRYTFQAISAQDPFKVLLDDLPLLTGTPGNSPATVDYASRVLEKGPHRLYAEHWDPNGRAVFVLSWATDASPDFKPIPTENFVYAPADLGNVAVPVAAPPPAELSFAALLEKPPPLLYRLEEQMDAELTRLQDREDFEAAGKLVSRLDELAKLRQDAFLAARIAPRVPLAKAREMEGAAYKSANAALLKNASDKTALTTVGRFRCLLIGDGKSGLQFLADGTDAALAGLAKRELKKAPTPADKVAIGEAWWLWGEKQPAHWKEAARFRALSWFRAAFPDLDVQGQKKLQPRLDVAVAARIVDLAPLLDPDRGAVEGVWGRDTAGAIIGQGPAWARAELAYEPPAGDYDYRIVFTRKGASDVNQILAAGGKSFVWQMGAYGNSIMGFTDISGVTAREHPSSKKHTPALNDDQRYVCVVKVRKDRVTALLNGDPVVEWKTDYRDMSMDTHWPLRDPKRLGLGTYGGRTIFHRVEVLELPGRWAPPPSSSSPTPAPVAEGWKPIFDGKTLDFLADAKGAWKVENGMMVSDPSRNEAMISRSTWTNGEIRMVFESRGTGAFWIQVRHGAGRGYQATLNPDILANKQGTRRELRIEFRGNTVRATLDGQEHRIEVVGPSSDGPLLFSAGALDFRIHSLDYRP